MDVEFAELATLLRAEVGQDQVDGTVADIKLALDSINQILKRRSIIFLVSDFYDDPESYRKPLYMTNRKHDVIAVDLHDPLETYIADVGVLTLEDAIRKMTSFPAQRMGLLDRGLLRAGMWADMVVFNPDTVIDKATYENPHQFSEGIQHLIVNGQIVVENETQNEDLPGAILRRPT